LSDRPFTRTFAHCLPPPHTGMKRDMIRHRDRRALDFYHRSDESRISRSRTIQEPNIR
jgi:hypothetical protein